MKYLIVVDMQNDFISGSLGSDMAKAIVPNVVSLVKNFDGKIIFTRDTHTKDYLNTQEGSNLPIEHCIKGTWGWQICSELSPYTENVTDKIAFGSVDLPKMIDSANDYTEIHLCGLCTDICVISNAMILKASFPETKMYVHESCCAGVTEQSHINALSAMRSVQIEIV